LRILEAPNIMYRALADECLAGHAPAAGADVDDISFSMSRADYEAAFKRVMDYIRAGDVYQINLTMLARFAMRGDPVALYRALCARQPVAPGALIETGTQTVLSLSPELFIERRGERVVTRPM